MNNSHLTDIDHPAALPHPIHDKTHTFSQTGDILETSISIGEKTYKISYKLTPDQLEKSINEIAKKILPDLVVLAKSFHAMNEIKKDESSYLEANLTKRNFTYHTSDNMDFTYNEDNINDLANEIIPHNSEEDRNKIDQLKKNIIKDFFHQDDEFERMETKWTSKDGHEAKQVIKRIKTIDQMIEIKEKEIAYYESKVTDLEGNSEKINKMMNKIANLKSELAKLDAEKTSWKGTNYFRDLVRNSDVSTWKGYEEATKDYLSVPVNMRIHKIETNKTESDEVVRLGIISDMRNGFTNLKELKEIKMSLESLDPKKQVDGIAQLKALGKKILKMKQEELDKGHKNIAGAFDFALKQIFGEDLLKEILKPGFSMKTFEFDTGKVLKEINTTIEQRREFLKNQAVALIIHHAGKTDIKDINTLKVLDVRIVNPRSKTVDPHTGFCHDEENELLDMAEIFEELSEKKLICDGKGPFVDEKGNIHLPNNYEAKEINLFAAVLNNNVKDLAKNEGISKELNDATLKRYKDTFGTDDGLQELLKKPRTSYSSAIKLMNWALKADSKVSVGCFGGKDRTGFICAAWAAQKTGFSTDEQRKIIKSELKKGSDSTKVAQNNTQYDDFEGTSALKVGVILPGVTDHLSGALGHGVTLIRQLRKTKEENDYNKARSKEKESIKPADVRTDSPPPASPSGNL